MNKNIKYSQNFLTSEKVLNQIIKQLNLKETDTVYEIGTGKGHLTTKLAKISKQVTSIELDSHLFNLSSEKLKLNTRVTLIHQDTLLAPLKSDYDLIIIDTVPTPSVYTNNAIVASDYVMIPLQAEESTNNIQNYISYLIDLQEQFNPGLDMIGFVPYLVDTDSTTIKSNLEELYKQHKEDNLVFQNIIKRSNKVSTWSKNGITEHKGYDKKVLSMYENVFFEMLERIIQLENEKE